MQGKQGKLVNKFTPQYHSDVEGHVQCSISTRKSVHKASIWYCSPLRYTEHNNTSKIDRMRFLCIVALPGFAHAQVFQRTGVAAKVV